ncbi:MAG: hypothetical protein BIFFINMI_00476 [Phycisphaerae bacterium]|nr:hypothetical protein [Phycisphaerae bacterium]
MRDDINVVLGGVGVVKGSVRNAGPAMVKITREINPYLVEDGFLLKAPFCLLNGVFRYGMRFDPHAGVGPIDIAHRELPFSMEVELAVIARASKEEVEAVFLKALVPALFAIALEFDLPVAGLTAFAESRGFSISKEN